MRSQEDLALIAAIADDLAAGIWVATVPEGRFVYANRAFEEIMGMGAQADVAAGEYAAPYGIYSRDGALYPEDKMPFVRAVQARAVMVVDDIVIHRRDGGRVFVRAFAKPMFAGGEMTHVAIAFFDITREVEAESARSRAEDRVHRLVENAPVILFALDRDGVITLAEGQGLHRLGRTQADLVGRTAFDLYPSAPVIAESCRRALAGETVKYVVDLGAGRFETRLSPLRDDAGAVVGAIGVSTDVTEQSRMEAQLAQAERLASVGMLAAGVAHEINNPLSYVIANLDLIARTLARLTPLVTGDAIGSLERMIRDARGGADRVRAIVRDLKVFSRVEDSPASAVDVGLALDAAMSLARNEVHHRARVVLDLAPVPPVWADAGRLAQLFLNLIVNAAHAIPEGAAGDNEVRIATRLDPGGWVRVEVTDTGAGMTAETQAKIFDPFFTTKEQGVGMGLGLSICHAIVVDLGGRIEVDSQVARGTTFRVFFPPAALRAHPEPARPRKSEVAPPPAARGTVLVVDDEPLILKVVTSLLALSYDVTSESNARAALDRIRRGERYDVVICDLMMPEMTGMDLFDAVSSLAPEQARLMLFLTGGAFTPRAREFLDRVPNATLEKPFDAAALESRVREMIRSGP